MDNEQLKRIADALEEVLRLVKKDQEESKKRWEKEDEKGNQKFYEYTGDHSGFCDGIEEDYLEEVKDDKI